MELKQDHSKEHNLSFVFVLTVIKTQFNNLLCIEQLACVHFAVQESLLGLNVLKNELTLKQDVAVAVHRYTFDYLHW